MTGADQGPPPPTGNATTVILAIRYALSGWRVVWAPDGLKYPIMREWQKNATTDLNTVVQWFTACPDANVCIVTGQASNLWVLDVDDKGGAGGTQSLAALEREHGSLPETYAVGTGSGGVHYYFTWDGIDFDLRNSAGKLGPGLDTRGNGGQVVAPPSRADDPTHITPYVVLDERPPVTAPAWLTWLLRPAPRAERQPGAAKVRPFAQPRQAGYAATAFRGEVASVLAAPVGTRNDALYRAAFSLGTLVASGDLDVEVVTSALTEAGHRTGLGATETENTIASGLRAGMQYPREAA
jgi:hypothetical protein